MIKIVLLFYQLFCCAEANFRPLMGRQLHSPVDTSISIFYCFDPRVTGNLVPRPRDGQNLN